MATRFSSGVPGRRTAPGPAHELVRGFQEFCRAPLAVGSAFPASRWLIDALLAPVDWSRTRVVVELGPGTGRFTRALLDRLPSQAHLVAIDSSHGFIDQLTDGLPDPRLHAFNAKAQNLQAIVENLGIGPVDAIISGIPFSTLPPSCQKATIGGCRSVLAPDGKMLAYQMRRAIEPLLEDGFHDLRAGKEWRNLPPCHLYWASRPR